VQVGYMIGERVLRPAMVGVAKGGPARPASEADSSSGEAKPDAPRPSSPDATSRPKFDKRA
jgi:molecular chaperone GrpE